MSSQSSSLSNIYSIAEERPLSKDDRQDSQSSNQAGSKPEKPKLTSSNQKLNSLVLAIGQNQDKQAFVELFDLVSTRLKGYAMRCGANSEEAEEIVQEALLTVWRKASSFNPKSAAAITWLYTIVRNKRIDFARKYKHQEVQSDDLWPESATEGVSEELTTEVESDLNGQFVRNLLQTLPDEQRQIVYMVYFEGKTHTEIAGELDLPLGTIKSRLRLAIKKLDTIAKEQSSWLIIILTMSF